MKPEHVTFGTEIGPFGIATIPFRWLQEILALCSYVMTDVTRILSAIEQGDPHAAAQLLPLVYDELRKLAGLKLAQEKPGQTLQATALVHDAYLRLVDVDKAQHWNSRGHSRQRRCGAFSSKAPDAKIASSTGVNASAWTSNPTAW